MKRPTYISIREAAKKSKRAAIKSGIQKYLYLMSLSPGQLKKLPENFIRQQGCAICERYVGTKKCPLFPGCGSNCIDEWKEMYSAWSSHRNNTYSDFDYHKFITYATKIYLKLLEL